MYSLCMFAAMSAAVAAAGGTTEREILAGADARIAQHRTGSAELGVLDAEGRPLPAGTPLVIEQIRHAFLFGCNVFTLGEHRSPEANEAYARRFAELFNFATLPFYWWSYEPQPGKPGEARIDELARWCRDHGIVTKGHPLAWNYHDPGWLPDDPAGVMQHQTARIQREVRRFRELVRVWDVVNEATDYQRPELLKNAPKLTRAIREAGLETFLRTAFRTARAADPGAVLLINDYVVTPAYAEKVIRLLVDDQGRPLYDAIGIQSHQHGGAWTVEHTWQVCERFAAFGKPLHFTETTFLSGEQGWGLAESRPGFRWASTPEGEQRQAEEAARFYTVLFSHPAVEAITWWDFSDARAWQQAPAGLLRADMSPKPAYEALRRLIRDRWWTRASAVVGPDGRAGFRGFFGDYRVTAGTGGPSGTFSFPKGTDGIIEVRLK